MNFFMLNKSSKNLSSWIYWALKVIIDIYFFLCFINVSLKSRLLEKLVTLLFYLSKFRLWKNPIILADKFYSFNKRCHLLILEDNLIYLKVVSIFDKLYILILVIKDLVMLLKCFFLILLILCLNEILVLWIFYGYVWLSIGICRRIFLVGIHE